jgi:hypothetical protein
MEIPMRLPLALPLLLALVACGTPQEQCIARETRDLRVVERLITETQGNLQRGYALEEVFVERSVWVDCTPRVAEGEPAPKPQVCLDEVTDVVIWLPNSARWTACWPNAAICNARHRV